MWLQDCSQPLCRHLSEQERCSVELAVPQIMQLAQFDAPHVLRDGVSVCQAIGGSAHAACAACHVARCAHRQVHAGLVEFLLHAYHAQRAAHCQWASFGCC